MKLALSLYAATLLQTVAAGPYDFLYYPQRSCKGRAFGCRDLSQFVCCKSPPGRDNYPSVRVHSSGLQNATVLFTYDVRGGSCGGCQFTGVLDKCYDNTNPFNNGVVFGIPNGCEQWGAKALAASNGGQKVPALTENSNRPDTQCHGSAAINFATVNGLNYTLPAGVVEEVAKDLIDLKDEEFGIKWVHLKDN